MLDAQTLKEFEETHEPRTLQAAFVKKQTESVRESGVRLILAEKAMRPRDKWKLTRNEHSEKICDGSYMWVNAECLTRDIPEDEGCGLEFMVIRDGNSWLIEQWWRPLDSMPDWSDSVYDYLYDSFSGEIEMEF